MPDETEKSISGLVRPVLQASPQKNKAEYPSNQAQKNRLKGKKKWMPIFLAGLVTLTTLVGAVTLSNLSNRKFISPLPDNSALPSDQTDKTFASKEVIGFMPFWNLKEEESQRYHLLTQVAFFALQIDAQGNIKKLNEDGTEEPGWTAYKSQAFGTMYRKAKESGTKVILTIQALDSDVIENVVNDPQKRETVIDQTLEIIILKNLDGVNIDFEFGGAPSYTTTENFTRFVKEWKEALTKHNPNLLLSVDVYADAVAKVRLWEIPEIAKYADHIIIMAYDFHRASSIATGPIAPIHGAPKYWEYDLSKMLADYSKSVPLDKTILGVAYYGYEWQASSEEPYAGTYPRSGATATYNRVMSLIEENTVKLSWDETALSPWLTYTENGKTKQIYYENEISLGLKYDLVNESGMAGVAIWALGYDGQHPNLWNLLVEKFLLQEQLAR